MVSHSWTISTYFNFFWFDPYFEAAYPTAPHGSVADDYPVVWDLRDDGANIPVNPEIPFEDQVSIEQTGASKVLFEPESNVVLMRFRADVHLETFMDLRRFPFDRCAMKAKLNFRSGKFHHVHHRPVWVPNRWGYDNSVMVTIGQGIADEFDLPSSDRMSCCELDCSDWKPTIIVYLERKPRPWIVNVILPTFLILLFSYSSFAIPTKNIADRLSLTVTLLLTQAALKFTVSSGLPTVPYITYMEYYFIFSYILITTNGVLNLLSFLFWTRATGRGAQIDLVAGSVGSASCFVIHIFLVCYNSCFREHWDLVKNHPSKLKGLAAIVFH